MKRRRGVNIGAAIAGAVHGFLALSRRMWLSISARFPGPIGLLLVAAAFFFGAAAHEALSAWRSALPAEGVLGAAFGAVVSAPPWDERVRHEALGFGLAVGGLGLASLGIYDLRYAIFDFTLTQRRGADAPKRPVIIMLLSNLTAQAEIVEKAVKEAAQRGLAENCRPNAPAFETRGGALTSWQQNLRVLKHHFLGPNAPKRKGRVVVIPSMESAPQFELFKRLADGCLAKEGLPDRVEIKRAVIAPRLFEAGARDGVDYRDLRELGAAFRRAIAEEQRVRSDRARERDICIDATAGMKVTSIAAAATTFGSDILFSYVETFPLMPGEEPEINVFDVRTALRARGE